MALPPAAREKAAAGVDIGYGNVVKILLRFASKWWAHHGGEDLADLSFLFSDATVPTWWTQHPAQHPVLTGWFAGPKADRVAPLTGAELVEMGLLSLAEIFDLPPELIKRESSSRRARSTGATTPMRAAPIPMPRPRRGRRRRRSKKPDGGGVFFSGEALYAGRDMGTVEAALASGKETAQTILAAGR